MNIPCNNSIKNCPPCDDSVFANFSTEAIDVDRALSVDFYLGDPSLNTLFGQLGCKQWAWSTISQSAADLAASQQAKECVVTTYKPPNVTPAVPPVLVFTNAAQTCSFTCASGKVNTATVDAGTVSSGISQDDADAMANSIACSRAQSTAHCGNVTTTTYFNVEYTAECPTDSVNPTIPSVTIPAGTYKSTVSQEDADTLAIEAAEALLECGGNPTAWWRMDESGVNDRVDAIGGVHLVVGSSGQNSSVSSDTGISGIATRIITSGTPGTPADMNGMAGILGGVNAPGLADTGHGYTVTGWVKFADYGNSTADIFLYSTQNSVLQLFFNKTDNLTLNPGTLNVGLANFTGSGLFLAVDFLPDRASFYFFRVWYDASLGRIGLQLFGDNGQEVIPATYNPSGAAFIAPSACAGVEIESLLYSSSTSWSLIMTVDEVNFFPRVISDAAVSFLLNGGQGRTWPCTVPT